MLEYDVVIISDFRLPGGTNRSTAQELEVHREHGIRTGLIQCNSRLSTHPRPWSDAIINCLEPGLVEPVMPGIPVRARLALLRHPIALEAMPDLSRTVHTDQAIIVANQTAVRPDGTPDYDAAEVNEHVTQQLGGVIPLWAPIGPVVRESLARWSQQIQLRATDWTNIFAGGSEPLIRSGFNSQRPVIGRHARPQAAKWPDNAEDILSAYPASDDFEVRILGGAKPAEKVLGQLPANWTVHDFGAIEPEPFLQELDFWVYFHHPQWLEAYGRAIMEALWSGAVVILPEYLKGTYGEAAVYGRASDVRQIIDSFRSGARNFRQQSALGQKFATSHSPTLHLERVRDFIDIGGAAQLVEEAGGIAPSRVLQPKKPTLSTAAPVVRDRLHVDERPRALFITSNGAGMGHLTRMLSIARATADAVEPVFFSMSQGLSVVSRAGFPYEYVPFNSAMQTKSVLWHKYLEDRLAAAIEYYNAEIIVFDGTWPYRGLLSTMRRHDLLKVWIRRGMWKPTISPEQLSVGSQFDVIIEPGDYARSYDTGATTMVDDAHRVGPMTVLSADEVLPRPQALAELGLPATGRRFALVTLGAGNINDVTSTQSEFLSAIESKPGWDAILTKVPIAVNAAAEASWSISAFPLARYTNAFDFAVSATGYNSFSEWMAGGLPTIWVPNLDTQTDDQDARARWAEDNEYGLRVASEETADIAAAVEKMTSDSWRAQLRANLATLPGADGAADAAEIIKSAWAHQRDRRRSS